MPIHEDYPKLPLESWEALVMVAREFTNQFSAFEDNLAIRQQLGYELAHLEEAEKSTHKPS